MERKQVRIGDDTLELVDSGGAGPVVVFLHGVLMDEQMWMPVVERHQPRLRCVVLVLSTGAHRFPRSHGADQSPRGIARLVGEFIDEVGLRDLTLVGNDTGGAFAQLLLAERPDIAARVVLTSCDAFENFPPGLPGRTMALACAMPGGLRTAMASLRIPALRRLPMTFGWMTKRPIDETVFSGWLDAFSADKAARRDVIEMMRQVDRNQLVEAAAKLVNFTGETLIVWAAEDKVMPVRDASRLRDSFKSARLEFIEDSYTLIPLDQPDTLARLIDDFVPAAA